MGAKTRGLVQLHSDLKMSPVALTPCICAVSQSHLGQFLHGHWSLQQDRVKWPGEGFITSFLIVSSGRDGPTTTKSIDRRVCLDMAPELRMDFTNGL